jgi:hypothetical protein
MGFFVKHLPRNHCKMSKQKFLKWYTTWYVQITTWLHIKRFLGTSYKKRQNVADSVGSGSNLNYKCLIVCSWFFEKNIFRFTIIYFIRDPQFFYKIQYIGKNVHARRFGHILNQAPKIKKKTQKHAKPLHSVMLCDLVARNNNKRGLSQIF